MDDDAYYRSKEEKPAFSLLMKVIVSVLPLLLILALEPIYNQPLFESSLEYIENAQKDLSDKYLRLLALYGESARILTLAPILINLL